MKEKIEYEAIDLGLPSGTLWAKKNIGAETEEDAGLYFQWGDIQGYTAEQVGVDKQFNWDDYKWSIDGTTSKFSKYNGRDGLFTLESSDDAATQIMGSDWRMPTNEELIELIDNTDIYYVSTTGQEIQATPNSMRYFNFPKADSMKGMKFYKKDDHTKYIFIPVSDEAYYGSTGYPIEETTGFLWSSSLAEEFLFCGWCLFFHAPYGQGFINYNDRASGFPIRGVKQKD